MSERTEAEMSPAWTNGTDPDRAQVAALGALEVAENDAQGWHDAFDRERKLHETVAAKLQGVQAELHQTRWRLDTVTKERDSALAETAETVDTEPTREQGECARIDGPANWCRREGDVLDWIQPEAPAEIREIVRWAFAVRAAELDSRECKPEQWYCARAIRPCPRCLGAFMAREEAAHRAGAEAMREACALELEKRLPDNTYSDGTLSEAGAVYEYAADAIRALPVTGRESK